MDYNDRAMKLEIKEFLNNRMAHPIENKEWCEMFLPPIDVMLYAQIDDGSLFSPTELRRDLWERINANDETCTLTIQTPKTIFNINQSSPGFYPDYKDLLRTAYNTSSSAHLDAIKCYYENKMKYKGYIGMFARKLISNRIINR